MSSILDRLPAELFSNIVKALDPDSFSGWQALSKLRQANKPLSVVVTPLVFETVTLWPTTRGYTKLDNIASHRIISKYVRKVIINPLRFDVQEHLKSGKDVYAAHVYKLLQRDMITINQYDLGVYAHKEAMAGYLKRQEDRRKDEADELILLRIFRQLQFVNSIHIFSGSRWIGAKEVSEHLRYICPKSVSADCEYLLPRIIDTASAVPLKLRELKIVDVEQHAESDEHDHLAHAYAPLPKVSRTLIVDTIDPTTWKRSGRSSTMLAELESLDIRFCAGGMYDASEGPLHESLDDVLSVLIPMTQSLTSLTLNGIAFGEAGLDIVGLATNIYQLALRQLHVEGVVVTDASDATYLLTMIGATFEAVSLLNCFLTGEFFLECMLKDMIRMCKLPRLKSCLLSVRSLGLLRSGKIHDVTDFILGRASFDHLNFVKDSDSD